MIRPVLAAFAGAGIVSGGLYLTHQRNDEIAKRAALEYKLQPQILEIPNLAVTTTNDTDPCGEKASHE